LLSAPEPPTVVDVRWSLTGPPGRVDYRADHLPGAVFMDLDTDLAGPPGPGGRHPLPDPAALQTTLRAAGVHAAIPVVAYDAADGSVAARVWWLLRWAGHQMVAVLDGGIAGWRAAGPPVTVELPQPQTGTFTVRPRRDAGARRAARRGTGPRSGAARCSCGGPVPRRHRAGRSARRPHPGGRPTRRSAS
jgi:thiosulfate/3-mercaptopyruvate sulfurtransferase